MDTTTPILIREANLDDAATLFDLVRQFSVLFVPEHSELERAFAKLLDNEEAWIGMAGLASQPTLALARAGRCVRGRS